MNIYQEASFIKIAKIGQPFISVPLLICDLLQLDRTEDVGRSSWLEAAKPGIIVFEGGTAL